MSLIRPLSLLCGMAGQPPCIDPKNGLQIYLLLRRAESFYPSPSEIKAVHQRINFVAGVGMSFRSEMGIFDGGQQAEMAKDLL